MLGGTMVKARRCPACATETRERRARWCGSCGAPLDPAPEAAAEQSPGTPPLRRVHVLVVVALVAGALAWAAVGSPDRGDAVVRDAAVAAPDDAVLDRVDRRGPTPVPGVEAPVCEQADDHRCFLWVVEATSGGFDAVTATGERILITREAPGGSLTVRDLDDGSVLWSAEVARWFSGHAPQVSGDLLLHVEEGELTGRDIDTGEVRWRTDELGRFAPWQYHRADDVLVVAGESHRATLEAGGPPHAVTAGLDPATGAVLWSVEGRSASLGAGGTAVVVTDDGQLRAHGPSGELRWEVEADVDVIHGGVWAHGHLIHLHDQDAGEQLLRLRDGAPLGFDGYTLASDDEHTLVEVHRGTTASLVLIDEDGAVWEVGPEVGRSGCWFEASLSATTVQLGTCGGGAMTLARSDGEVLARTTPADNGTWIDPGAWMVGPYVLAHDDPERGGSDLIVSDLRTGEQVARLPSDTWPVHGQQHGNDLGGVLVLQSRGWLTAFALPDHQDRPAR